MTSYSPIRPPDAPIGHRLFFAFLPPPWVIARLVAFAETLGLGRRVTAARLHATLFATASFSELPDDLVRQARRAAVASERPAVPVMLDQLVRAKGQALVRASEPPSALALFQRQLQLDLRRAGVAPLAGFRFHPHCTLGYGGDGGPSETIDPIEWTASELVLIHSLIGLTEHRVLGRWPLVGRSA